MVAQSGQNTMEICYSVPKGLTISEEIRACMWRDINAITPLYRRRFQESVKQCPTLEDIYWHPTKEVLWHWMVSSRGEEIKLTQEVEMNHEPQMGDEYIASSGTFHRVRRSDSERER